MKTFYSIIACIAVATTAFNAVAQVRWNPAEWQVVDGANTQLVDNSHMEVVVTPVSGKDHCHIYNAVDLTFTADEPYLIIHFEASDSVRANKQHALFRFYNDFENYDNLTAEEIDGYDGYVFNEKFSVDKDDGYVVYRGKYSSDDEDIFTKDTGYNNTVERGNIWVIDLRKIPTTNGGYLFDKEDVQKFSITHTRSPWWTKVEGAPARMRSALQIEICTNVIPDGKTKADFLADKTVNYRYIATASELDIFTDAALSRANSADIDPVKVRQLIDNYRAKATQTGDYAEHRDVTTGINEIQSNVTAQFTINDHVIRCQNAVDIKLYSMSGLCLASVAGESIEAQSGIYIARAITTDGNIVTSKIIIK